MTQLRSIKHFATAALTLVGAQLVGGCSGAPDDMIEPDVGELAEGLSCDNRKDFGVCGTYTVTSPDTSYSSCSQGMFYVYDDTPPQVRVDLNFIVKWADTPLTTQGACNAAHLEGSYGWQSTNGIFASNASWRGVWNSNTGKCSFVGNGNYQAVLGYGAFYLWGSGKAYTTNALGGGVTYRKVSVGYQRSCGAG